MKEVPENIKNPNLYKKAVKEADKIYKRHGLYKSAFIQKKYQELGGKYKDSKPTDKEGIQRWLRGGEMWIEIEPYLKDNKKVICGSNSEKKKKACRPLKRVNDKTPITIPELIKIHGKDKLLKLARLKQENMDKRMNWKTGRFY